MRIAKLILILFIGGLLLYFTYQTRYHTFFFGSFIWGGLIFIGLLTVLWVIIDDLQQFRTKKQVRNFALSYLCLFFITTFHLKSKQTWIIILFNFYFLSLYQDVKRKQALLRSNLSAIIILTVYSNALWRGGYPASLFRITDTVYMAKKT